MDLKAHPAARRMIAITLGPAQSGDHYGTYMRCREKTSRVKRD
jgi:hypothetical protein